MRLTVYCGWPSCASLQFQSSQCSGTKNAWDSHLSYPISGFGGSLNAIWIKWELTAAFWRLDIILSVWDCDIDLEFLGRACFSNQLFNDPLLLPRGRNKITPFATPKLEVDGLLLGQCGVVSGAASRRVCTQLNGTPAEAGFHVLEGNYIKTGLISYGTESERVEMRHFSASCSRCCC